MVRHQRTILLFLVVSAICLAAASASEARLVAKGVPSSDGVCGNTPSASAIDQYCEVIPSATGGRGSGQGTPELATTLPRPVALKLLADKRRGYLLTLPAKAKVPRPAAITGPLTISGLQTISGLLWILALIGIALIALAAAAWWWRRRHAEGAPPVDVSPTPATG